MSRNELKVSIWQSGDSEKSVIDKHILIFKILINAILMVILLYGTQTQNVWLFDACNSSLNTCVFMEEIDTGKLWNFSNKFNSDICNLYKMKYFDVQTKNFNYEITVIFIDRIYHTWDFAEIKEKKIN